MTTIDFDKFDWNKIDIFLSKFSDRSKKNGKHLRIRLNNMNFSK